MNDEDAPYARLAAELLRRQARDAASDEPPTRDEREAVGAVSAALRRRKRWRAVVRWLGMPAALVAAGILAAVLLRLR